MTQILEEFNLSTLVSLHEPGVYSWENKYTIEIELFYLKPQNLNSTYKHPRFNEFWELWHTKNMSILNISKELLGNDGNRVELGGRWRPIGCISKHKVAIIIPFKDRIPHLRVNIEYMHMILQRQMLDYRIYVVEGKFSKKLKVSFNFNKGRIWNAGKFEV